ncbi:MAG TPA: hypothetical protein VGF99_18750 [Myxococcota bacterium]
MKNLITALALVAAAPALAIPDVVSWSARVDNDAGAFDGTVSVTFTLFDAAEAGTSLWSESAASAEVVDGDLVHELGSIEPLDDALLDRDNLFLQITMNGDVLSPRSALRAVPYAMRAHDAEVAEVALLADDATTLGGLAPTAFQFSAASGGGLALTGTQFSIAAASINSARLADGAVTTAKIAPGAVTTAQIGVKAVTTTQIADNAVTSVQITNGTIVGDDIAAASIVASKLAVGAVSGNAIANGGIPAGKLTSGAVSLGNVSGSSARVRTRPAGCGGGLQAVTGTQNGFFFVETTSCLTQVCGIASQQIRFANCQGVCTQPEAVTCNLTQFGDVLGSVVFGP